MNTNTATIPLDRRYEDTATTPVWWEVRHDGDLVANGVVLSGDGGDVRRLVTALIPDDAIDWEAAGFFHNGIDWLDGIHNHLVEWGARQGWSAVAGLVTGDVPDKDDFWAPDPTWMDDRRL